MGPGPSEPGRPALAALLGLERHPEGGWFRRTWRAPVDVTVAGAFANATAVRPTATGIYYLLGAGERSAWHQVRSDELWLHHRGVPLRLSLGGSGTRPVAEVDVVLGSDVAAGQQPQVLVPAGTWQAARPDPDGEVLVSCIVSPGFDWADWSLG